MLYYKQCLFNYDYIDSFIMFIFGLICLNKLDEDVNLKIDNKHIQLKDLNFCISMYRDNLLLQSSIIWLESHMKCFIKKNTYTIDENCIMIISTNDHLTYYLKVKDKSYIGKDTCISQFPFVKCKETYSLEFDLMNIYYHELHLDLLKNGIINYGNNCYYISALQILRKLIPIIQIFKYRNSNNEITQAFINYLNTEKFEDLRNHIHKFKIYQYGRQQDTVEFIYEFLNTCSEIKPFVTITIHIEYILSCNHIIKERYEYQTWICTLEESILECLKRNISKFKTTDSKFIHCNKCSSTCSSTCKEHVRKIINFHISNIDFPSVLIISLKRNDNYILKVNKHVDIPERIYLSDFYDKKSHLFYILRGYITHHGNTLLSGHYKAYVREPYNKTWYEYNDNIVNPVMSILEQEYAYVFFYELSFI